MDLTVRCNVWQVLIHFDGLRQPRSHLAYFDKRGNIVLYYATVWFERASEHRRSCGDTLCQMPSLAVLRLDGLFSWIWGSVTRA
jgi:hypothetical protein